MRRLDTFQIRQIYQTYLKSTIKDTEIRVRAIVDSRGNQEYWVTQKERLPGSISANLQRRETEWQIDRETYNELLKFASGIKLTKTRLVIPFQSNLLEIDIYGFWRTQAILEIEDAKVNGGKLDLPPGIHIIKEVTHNKNYTNYELAKRYGADIGGKH